MKNDFKVKTMVFLMYFFKILVFSQSLSWNNQPNPLELEQGKTILINATYNTDGNSFNYIWLKLQKKNSSDEIIEEFNSVFFNGTNPVSNQDTINILYKIADDIPLSSELKDGEYYYFLFSMWTSAGWTSIDLRPLIIENSSSGGGESTNVIANLDVNHIIGNIKEFKRSKFINIHSDQIENEWNGDNAANNLRDDFLNDLDVYMGRNTGGISWQLSQMKEDTNRKGYVDTLDLKSRASDWRNHYAQRTEVHPYEIRNNLIVAGQLHPFWTGEGQQETGKGWKFANASATGDYMGRYIKEFHSDNGQPKPTWIEVINEPAYERLGGASNFTNDILDIAEFHNDVADAIKVHLPNAKVGGYTTAFPNFEKGNFKRWKNRWKLFMDVAGDKMDFWSIHLYDWPSINNGKKEFRSGGNVEATFDMMEQYSIMKFGIVKPFIISEYGAQTNDYNKDQWSAYRDWLHVRSSNSLLMSFMDRPNLIASAINFLIVKAEWGFFDGIPYNHRLMRKENEPNSYTGKWVYSDMVKLYELWSKVKGKRIDTKSDNLDIQIDGYVDNNKAYIILNNLNFVDETINLNLFGVNNNMISSINKKQTYTDGNALIFDDESIDINTKSIILKSEATVILEYTFANNLEVNETNIEKKYYANEYLKEISTNTPIIFNINNVEKKTFGEAVLRIGLGRLHNLSLKPILKVNNTIIEVPDNWRGDNQFERERFFGLLEIPVSYDLLNFNNKISIEFPDSTGYISSVTMQVYEFNSNIRERTLKNQDFSFTDKVGVYPNPTNGILNLNNLSIYKKISIFNLNGKKLKTFTNKQILDVKDLSDGVYILKTDNGFVTKFIKN